MPDIEVPDPEELGGNVTKPFKFVTGTRLPLLWMYSFLQFILTRSIAGYDARFPNQNQYDL